MSWKNTLGLSLVGAFVFGCIGVCIYFWVVKQMWYVLYLFLFWIIFIAAGSEFNVMSRSFHLHHWTVGMIFTTMLSYPHWLFTLLHGLCCGVMLDGGARWGWDDVWEKNEILEPGKWSLI